MPIRPSDTWTPQYFLASLGNGGIAVAFFLWLYMWIPHNGQPVPVFEDISAAWAAGNPVQQAMIVTAMAGIAYFAFQHYRTLIWNLGRHAAFKASPAHDKTLNSNAASTLMGLPLALAMAVNVGFVLGLVFVPGLWGVVEYLFPLALAAFVALAVIALRMLGGMLARYSVAGTFDKTKNGSFAQVQPAFALAMIGVGASAPAALSGNPTVVAVALSLSTLMLTIALIWAAVAVVLGIAAMVQHGAQVEGIPTLMNIVPLTTVLGILTLRQQHGLHMPFGSHFTPGDDLSLITTFIAIQLAFLGLGWTVTKKHNYISRFVTGAGSSPGSYGLICPGVGLSVMLQFWINKALVGAGLLAKFSAAYWAFSALPLIALAATIALMVGLNRKHFGTPKALPIPAE